MKAILFDIDGTLADNWHRQHLVQSDAPDWEKFFEGISQDTLNEPVVALYELVKASALYTIILVSGRPERYRGLTTSWLDRHNITFNKLYMRPDGDRRPDFTVKKDMLDAIVGDGYEILFVIDDRTQTVNMWRENGIACLQCADHNF